MRRTERRFFYRNRGSLGGLPQKSVLGYGFTSCGSGPVGTTERFDDVANIHTARTNAIARHALAGYSPNGYGFTSGAWLNLVGPAGTKERFDDVANMHTARTNIVTRAAIS